ncbi:type III-A CRISPR-associated RAMP protein Csm5 [Methanocaldococcus sp.]
MIVKCKVLSPVFIGCGDEYTPLDYFIENGKVYIVDFNKVLDNINDIKKINEITDYIKQNIHNNRIEVNAKDILSRLKLCPTDDNYVSKSLDCEIKNDSKTRVKKFISQNGVPYIPGSSIKGAIRTAYLFYYYDKHFTKLLKILNLNNHKSDSKKRHVNVNDIEKKLIKYAISNNIQNDFFKYLKISDSLNLNGTFKFINTQRWYIKKRHGNPFGVKEDVEALVDGNFDIDIKIEDEFINEISKKLKLKTSYNIRNETDKFEILKDICNSFAECIVEFELKRNYPIYIEDFYEKLLKDIKNNNAIYLNLGFGGGFFSKTIYPLLWKHDKENKKFDEIKELFIKMAGNNEKLIKAWQSAEEYTDFPTTKTVYVKNESAELPMGWIKIEREV